MALFPDRLKGLRKAKAVTQKTMAEYLGVTDRSYRYYEAGDLEPNHATTIRLADYFGVTIDYLLGRTDNPK